MAPTALAGRRHSQGVPRPAMARPPGETRVSRSRPEGMRRRENQPIHGPDSLGRSEAQPRCASTCDGSPSRRDSRKPKQARRDAPARKPAHPWPRQPGPSRRTPRVRRTARRSHLRATVAAAHAAARDAASGRCVRLHAGMAGPRKPAEAGNATARHDAEAVRDRGFAGRPGGRTSGRPWPPRTRRHAARPQAAACDWHGESSSIPFSAARRRLPTTLRPPLQPALSRHRQPKPPFWRTGQAGGSRAADAPRWPRMGWHRTGSGWYPPPVLASPTVRPCSASSTPSLPRPRRTCHHMRPARDRCSP
jgi:hypothetical protein